MASMEIVGLHLQREAVKSGKPAEESDLFGRSAYNRYYYASFLCVRRLLIELEFQVGQATTRGLSELIAGDYKNRN